MNFVRLSSEPRTEDIISIVEFSGIQGLCKLDVMRSDFSINLGGLTAIFLFQFVDIVKGFFQVKRLFIFT
jgi:hypothetical protein